MLGGGEVLGPSGPVALVVVSFDPCAGSVSAGPGNTFSCSSEWFPGFVWLEDLGCVMLVCPLAGGGVLTVVWSDDAGGIEEA